MSDFLHDFRYPGETEDYREARNELLKAEVDLIAQVEKVAAMRRSMPMGGELIQDYVFEEGSADFRDTQTVIQTPMSGLFADGKPTLIMINMMFSPDKELPCPSCNCLADGYNATAPHISERVNFVLVTKAPLKKLRAWAAGRNWNDIRLLSSFNNSFNTDYRTESEEFGQLPSITVFNKGDDGVIRHFYSIEGHLMNVGGGDPRHLDLYWPLWQLLDLTPEGRGQTWYPDFSYPSK
jgi:predicted dithiol-disulfide oxidoreductase (DUF899 family)